MLEFCRTYVYFDTVFQDSYLPRPILNFILIFCVANVVVTLHRDHTYDNIETIKAELSCKVMELSPPGLSRKVQVKTKLLLYRTIEILELFIKIQVID